MVKKTGRNLVQWIRENHARLAACADHDFTEDITPERAVLKHWRCTRCQGEVDSINKIWYEAGRRQERSKHEQG
jgi:hypothetical protein